MPANGMVLLLGVVIVAALLMVYSGGTPTSTPQQAVLPVVAPTPQYTPPPQPAPVQQPSPVYTPPPQPAYVPPPPPQPAYVPPPPPPPPPALNYTHLTFPDTINGYTITCPSGQNIQIKNFKYGAPGSSCTSDVTSTMASLITGGKLAFNNFIANWTGDPCPGVPKQGDVDAACTGGSAPTGSMVTSTGATVMSQTMPSAGMYPTMTSNQLQDSQSGGSITCAPKKLVFNKFRYGDPVSNCWGDFTAMANAAVNGGQSLSWNSFAVPMQPGTGIPGLGDPCPGVPKVVEYDQACY